MSDFHVKKIILPSGKAVEIVYFHAEGDPEAVEVELPVEPAEQAARIGSGLELCPQCASDLVYPVDWRERGERWELELRCPNCEWSERSTHTQEQVECFDEILNAGTDSLIGTLEKLTRENMEADIDRFVRALESDAIEPMDF